VINEPLSGERFNAFVQSIQQPAIVLFDEFEKTYRMPLESELKSSSPRHNMVVDSRGKVSRHRYGDDHELPNPSQDAILTLLDGVYPSNMLFILTANDKTRITKNLMNRPGRILYSLEFSGLDPELVRDYCNDNLVNKTLVDEVVIYGNLFKAFSFDMMQALVQEMNMYQENTGEVLKWLNIDLGKNTKNDLYLVSKLVLNGRDMTNSINVDCDDYVGNPVTDPRIVISVNEKRNWFGWPRSVQRLLQFRPSEHLVKGNITSGVFEFQDNKKKQELILERLSGVNALYTAMRLDM